MAVVALFFECLADLDNIGGYFNSQLKPRDKSPTPQFQRDDTQREESPLFMEQDKDVLNGASNPFIETCDDTTDTTAEARGSDLTVNDHTLLAPVSHALQNAAIRGREDDFPQVDEVAEEARVGGSNALGWIRGAETEPRSTVLAKGRNEQVTLPTPQAPTSVHSRTRRLVTRATRDYEALKADFTFLSWTHKSLRRKFAKRIIKYRRRELHVCQGNCFNDLEEADHSNWEKGREIDALNASVAELQSQVKVLRSVVAERDEDYKEKCEENIQLKARIQELEQHTKKGKTVRFAASTK
jgi:hypothetical protein